MAKKNMAKKKKKAVYLSPQEQMEADYQRAIRRMHGADKMYQAKDKVQMYRQAVKMFDKLGSYEESENYKKWCKERLPSAREEYREETYQTGMRIKETAKEAADYEEAIEEFQKIKKNYKDVLEQIEQCRQLKQKARINERNKRYAKKLFSLAGIAAAAAVIFYLRTPAAFYQGAGFLMCIGDYERASTLFARSIGYKDTKERRQECDYQRAVRFAQSGDYQRALEILDSRVGSYKDAMEKKARFELKILSTAETGDTVVYGTDRWVVAEITDGQALLIKKKPDKNTAYLASGKDTNWEQSDIRTWLNNEFYQKHFSADEQTAILQTEVLTEPNSIHGTDGGGAAMDRVFLLNEKQAVQYKELLAAADSQKAWWLRTPGKTADSAAFVSPQGTVMHDGYTVDSKEIAARPAVWVAVSRSEAGQ